MLISVPHSMATSLQTPIIDWRKLKEIDGKMYSQTNNMEQDSTKNRLALAKTNRVFKYTPSVLKLSYSEHKYKDSSKKILSLHYFSHVFEK